MPTHYGYSVDERTAHEALLALFESPITAIDTADAYSDGDSEWRIGAAIRATGGLPAGDTILTKADGRDGRFDGARTRQSVLESQERLGLDHLPVVFLHDPEFYSEDDISGPGGAIEQLVELKAAGTIGHLGLAGGPPQLMSKYLDAGVFEILLVHNRLTLVDRSATDLVDRAVREGIAVLNAAIYGGGLFANPYTMTKYAYAEAPSELLSSVRAMADACSRFEVPLMTVALQKSLRDPRVTSTVVGISRASRIESHSGSRDYRGSARAVG